MNTLFQLHEGLAADTVEVGRWPLNLVLLMNDANYPWLVLVPQRPGLRDLHDLAEADLPAMSGEMVQASRLVQSAFAAEKTNVAALGNQVPQLHIHVIARYASDPAWPGPIWGVQPARKYGDQALAERLALLRGRMFDSP